MGVCRPCNRIGQQQWLWKLIKINVVKENSDLVASLYLYSTLSTCITQLSTGHANNKSCLVVAVDKLQALHGYKTATHIIQNNIDDH